MKVSGDDTDYMLEQEVADLFEVSKNAVRIWVKRGYLKVARFQNLSYGRPRRLYRTSDVEELARKRYNS